MDYVEEYLQEQLDKEQMDRDIKDMILDISKKGDVAQLETFITAGHHEKLKEMDVAPVLYGLRFHASREFMEALDRAGLPWEGGDFSALFYIGRLGRYDLVDLGVKNCQNINQDSGGSSALIEAFKQAETSDDHYKTMVRLIAFGADIEHAPLFGYSVADLSEGNSSMVESAMREAIAMRNEMNALHLATGSARPAVRL